MAAQKLLGVHRQEVAVEHGRRLDASLSDSDIAGSSIGKSAGLQHAALHVVDARLEMHVAGLGVGPGVEDGDDRLAGPFLRRVAHLHRARAMTEGAQIVGREPARAAQLIGSPVPRLAVRHGLFLRAGRDHIHAVAVKPRTVGSACSYRP
jgi:hypothetical protein